MARADSGAPAPGAPGVPGTPTAGGFAGLTPEQIRQKVTLMNKLRLQQLHGKNPSHNMILHRGPIALPGAPAFSAVPQLNNASTASTAGAYTPSDTSEPNNPYASIVARNVFALNPPPSPDTTPQDSGPPPPKITLTGITTIFGPAEALYKVAGVVRDGKPPQDESYILTEGEGQDDVNVMRIDVKKGIVTFNNHGVTQDIPLQVGTASGGDSGGGGPGPANPFMRRFGGGGPGSQNFNNLPPAMRARFMQRFGNNQNNFGPNGNNNNFNPVGTYNGSYNNYSGNNNSQNSTPQLSADDNEALIAAQKAQLEQQGNSAAAIFPPTKYDDQARQEAGGSSEGAPMP